ncbi:hypothetical protein ACVOMT_05235 [Sphingomonas panni]
MTPVAANGSGAPKARARISAAATWRLAKPATKPVAGAGRRRSQT